MDDFADEEVLMTEYPEGRIRINVYYIPEKVVTANCVPILPSNHIARNGLIHMVDKILPNPTRTVADIIAGDSQFSILKRRLSDAGLVQALRSLNKTYTVFAATDSSFSGFLKEENNRCVIKAMRHHVVEHVICSRAIPRHARSMSAAGDLLTLTRDVHGKLYVDDAQVVVRDLVATNGVVHVIDGFLSTKRAKIASQLLEEYSLHEYNSLLRRANLQNYYDSLDNVTFFIPSNEAIKSLRRGYLESLASNNDSLKSLLLYHVASGHADMTRMEQFLESKLENASLRIQVHAPFPHTMPQYMVQCATIVSHGHQMCGGTFHVINRLLLPPKLSAMEVLEGNEGFSTVVLLLRATGLDRRLRSADRQHSLLAPTDDAFHALGEHTLIRLLDDVHLATDLLRMHILSGSVCCSQLKSDFLSGKSRVRSVNGSILRLDRSRGDSLMIGGAHLVNCDVMATNGIVHFVDAIVRHEDLTMRNGGFRDMFLRI